MAYYTKQQVRDYFKEVLERAKGGEIKIMVNLEECARKLGDEQDLIPIFWVKLNQNQASNNINIEMDGSVFVRIEYDLYCDDRYALDCYQAVQEGISVHEVVKKRIEETSKTKSLTEEEKEEMANKLKEKLKNLK